MWVYLMSKPAEPGVVCVGMMALGIHLVMDICFMSVGLICSYTSHARAGFTTLNVWVPGFHSSEASWSKAYNWDGSMAGLIGKVLSSYMVAWMMHLGKVRIQEFSSVRK